jgi:hypothetical protein
MPDLFRAPDLSLAHECTRQYPGRMISTTQQPFTYSGDEVWVESPICHYILNHTLIYSRSNHHKSLVNTMERVFKLRWKALLAVCKSSRFVRTCCLWTSRNYVQVVCSRLGNSTCRRRWRQHAPPKYEYHPM